MTQGGITWGSSKFRGRVLGQYLLPISGFVEKGKWFRTDGFALILLCEDPKLGTSFRLATAHSEVTKKHAKHDRAPLVIPRTGGAAFVPSRVFGP